MCSNYRPVTSMDHLLHFFGVVRGRDSDPVYDMFPSGMAPMIRRAPADESTPEHTRVVGDAIFRFVPDFIARVDLGAQDLQRPQ